MEPRLRLETPTPQTTAEVLKRAKEFSFPNSNSQVKNLAAMVREEEIRILRQDLQDFQPQLEHLTNWPSWDDEMRSQYASIIFAGQHSEGLLITRSGTLLFDRRPFADRGRIATASLNDALDRFGLQAIRDGLANLFLQKLNEIELRKKEQVARLRQLQRSWSDL